MAALDFRRKDEDAASLYGDMKKKPHPRTMAYIRANRHRLQNLKKPDHQKKRESSPQEYAALISRFIKVESGGREDYLKKRSKIEDTIRFRYRAKDLIPGCGSMEAYEAMDIIGYGAFGLVHKAMDTSSQEMVAVKEVSDDGLSISLFREIAILKCLPPHPCIVELKDLAADELNHIFLVMELVEYDLTRYITVKDLSLMEIKMLMKQLLEGVQFLHQNMVMHRDIKPSNILVSEEGALKICDFGLSRRFKAGGGSYSPRVGTLPYRAPEMLRGETGYSCAVDMWAVGCTMAEVVTKKVMFSGIPTDPGQLQAIHMILGHGDEGVDSQLRSRLCGGAASPPLLSEAGLDLVEKLLSYDPSKRISAESALGHAWFHESTYFI